MFFSASLEVLFCLPVFVGWTSVVGDLWGSLVQSLLSPDLNALGLPFIWFVWAVLYLDFIDWWLISWWVLPSSWLTDSHNSHQVLYVPLSRCLCGFQTSCQLRFSWLFTSFSEDQLVSVLCATTNGFTSHILGCHLLNLLLFLQVYLQTTPSKHIWKPIRYLLIRFNFHVVISHIDVCVNTCTQCKN